MPLLHAEVVIHKRKLTITEQILSPFEQNLRNSVVM